MQGGLVEHVREERSQQCEHEAGKQVVSMIRSYGGSHRLVGRQDALFKDDDCSNIYRMALGAEDVMHKQEV